ncbi:TMEM165/GDT1 family protein [uncultured Thermosynechococcus sp.]|uniref:TMEM165/GDT1 family protein n=1 Tax=uncultured Thermosynechococcus sp. TaxID=436945 RepID=UPI0026022B5E|nr:TMEM165/GDT1 family protein [uncultured Thermosynechococcus sp.]
MIKRALPWREFGVAFLTVFWAEFADKTQIAVFFMAARAASPWLVFLGAALALVTTSLIGVLIGRWLSRYLSEQRLQTLTGSSLLAIALWLLWDMLHPSL